jgi:hypothetical protein
MRIMGKPVLAYANQEDAKRITEGRLAARMAGFTELGTGWTANMR